MDVMGLCKARHRWAITALFFAVTDHPLSPNFIDIEQVTLSFRAERKAS